MFGKKILVLAAHPDDEVVACAAAVARAQAQGASLFVLYLTHGCIAKETMWPWARKDYEKNVARRRAEGEEAAKLLGLIPVGWSQRPARHLWRSLPEVHGEIEAAVARHEIDQLWAPAFEGGNADHDALNAVTSLWAQSRLREAQSSRANISILEFAEYNFAGGSSRSHEFPHPNGSEQVIELTSAERGRKRAALDLYVSERCNLGYVKTMRESFRLLAAYDYSRPPHEGILWYARFQWVPFRHPRVDFTKPEKVSAAIMGFLEKRRV